MTRIAMVRMMSQRRRRARSCCAAGGGAVSTVASMTLLPRDSGRAHPLARRRDVATPECLHQVDAEGQPPRLELGAQRLREQHLVLAREHRQVVVETGAVAIARQGIGALRG